MFIIMLEKEKQQIFPFEKLEPSSDIFVGKITVHNELIIRIVTNKSPNKSLNNSCGSNTLYAPNYNNISFIRKPVPHSMKQYVLVGSSFRWRLSLLVKPDISVNPSVNMLSQCAKLVLQ